MTLPWLIIADDLTGAADCAIAFAKRGLESVVAWEKHTDAGGVQVLSVDAGTRRLPPEQAAKLQVDVLAAHYRAGLRLYKKIDSTVRGQPAAELAALLAYAPAQSEGRPRLAILAPAFPGTGRVTVNGSIVVQGVPLEQTPLWARDHTYASANLVEMLASAGLSAEVLPLDVVADPEKILAHLVMARSRGLAAVVCDAKTEADLAAVAAGSLPLADEVIWVGSAGLAAALAVADTADAQPPKTPPLVSGAQECAGGCRHSRRSLAPAGKDSRRGGIGASRRYLSRRAFCRAVLARMATGLPATRARSRRARRCPVGTGADSQSRSLARRSALRAAWPRSSKAPETPLPDSSPPAATPSTRCSRSWECTASGCSTRSSPAYPWESPSEPYRLPLVTKAGAFGDAQTLRRSLERLHR